jgi:hypothetical protein
VWSTVRYHRLITLCISQTQGASFSILTWYLLTGNQFVPRLAEFGRTKLPSKWGRILRRLTDPLNHEEQ